MEKHTRFWIARSLGIILTLVGSGLLVSKSPSGVLSAMGVLVLSVGVLLIALRVR